MSPMVMRHVITVVGCATPTWLQSVVPWFQISVSVLARLTEPQSVPDQTKEVSPVAGQVDKAIGRDRRG